MNSALKAHISSLDAVAPKGCQHADLHMHAIAYCAEAVMLHFSLPLQKMLTDRGLIEDPSALHMGLEYGSFFRAPET